MPLYDMKCNECGHEFEDIFKINELENAMCPKCWGSVRILITNPNNTDWFKPHWNENFDTEPVFVRSRNHLKQLCDQYGVISHALGDHRNLKEI